MAHDLWHLFENCRHSIPFYENDWIGTFLLIILRINMHIPFFPPTNTLCSVGVSLWPRANVVGIHLQWNVIIALWWHDFFCIPLLESTYHFNNNNMICFAFFCYRCCNCTMHVQFFFIKTMQIGTHSIKECFHYARFLKFCDKCFRFTCA